jgi:hypothetical protein
MVDKEIFSEWTPSPSCSSHQIVVYINIQELMCEGGRLALTGRINTKQKEVWYPWGA